MGEYATRRRDGAHIKIGTCESMYYLRFHQIHEVAAEPGNVDPVRDAAALRFRFPWPNEDRLIAGEIGGDDFERGVALPGVAGDGEVEHRVVQFTAKGYNLCVPCPEGPGPHPVTVHRNGFAGAVQLVAHRYRPELGRLVPVLRCGGCGTMWREEEPAAIDALAVAIRSEADRIGRRDGETAAAFWHKIADRLAPFVPRPEDVHRFPSPGGAFIYTGPVE